MILIQWPETDAYQNLAAEEYIFNQLDKNEEYLLFWQNRNAVVVGIHQNTVEEINRDFVESNDIQVVRRLTGGGAVYHDLGNLNYSFIVDAADTAYNFKLLTQPVANTLTKLGARVEFSGRNDLTIDGRKFSGNAQMKRGNRLLHHGTLLFNSNLPMLASALNVSAKKIESKGIKSVRSRVTNIQEHIPSVTIDTFKTVLLEEIKGSGQDVREYTLSAADLEGILALRRDKYSTWEWNYGRSPDYNERKELRFEGGTISLLLTIQKGRIQSMGIFGDFFGDGDIHELEARFTGVAMNEESVRQALDNANLTSYIQGITADDFVNLLFS